MTLKIRLFTIGFLEIFKELGENLIELCLVLSRPEAIRDVSGDDNDVSTTINSLMTEVLTNNSAETISVHGSPYLLFRSHKPNAMANRMLSVFR